MDTETEIKRLERRAPVREEQADEREAMAASSRPGGYYSMQSQITAEEYRAEAGELRARASVLRRQQMARR